MKQIRTHLQKNAQAGFTLIEILVVMVILGVLMAVAASSFMASQQKGRDARRKSDLHQIANSLEMYFNDKGVYPSSTTDGSIMGCAGGTACEWNSEFVDEKGTVYMVKLPQDPKGQKYYYELGSTGKSYQIFALLENRKDPGVMKDGQGNPQVYSSTNCGIGLCNFGIASSNATIETNHSLVNE